MGLNWSRTVLPSADELAMAAKAMLVGSDGSRERLAAAVDAYAVRRHLDVNGAPPDTANWTR